MKTNPLLFICFCIVPTGHGNDVKHDTCTKDNNDNCYESLARTENCNYDVLPLSKIFGARIQGIDLKTISNECARNLREEAYMYRFLLFKNQTLPWQKQIHVTSLFGTPFQETSSINRKKYDKNLDPRIGIFSNDHKAGLVGIGIEGWHVDGNIFEMPHLFTLIYCVHANSNGPTLIVPLKEIVDMLSTAEREYLENILFVSAFNSSVHIPLLYKHPFRNDDTLMIALGTLSGQYLQLNTDNNDNPYKQLSVEETKYIQDLFHAKILASNLIYSVNYDPGDFLMIHNPSVAHIAGPGTQTPSEISGLRLIHRSTVTGEIKPSKSTNIQYECNSFPPFEDEYCLFSLKGSVYYPRIGYYDDQTTARNRCKNINKYSDLANIYSKDWNDIATKIISKAKVPHWLNATNPQDTDVYWDGNKGLFSNWDPTSGQPNDHDGIEDCVVIGPSGYWFDLPCSGPKTATGTDRAPVMLWDGEREMRNVYPLCGIHKKYL
ncbi:unnamed protein product [Mytilus coruscus]|uniref:C-type lectin domain-containing protein n=1 Tax=Mytilus coruscus TaxID=42192 RepID=A0A6J8CV53_MYTCO|nr:unnamed protein product [Mytilus coruscus]